MSLLWATWPRQTCPIIFSQNLQQLRPNHLNTVCRKRKTSVIRKDNRRQIITSSLMLRVLSSIHCAQRPIPPMMQVTTHNPFRLDHHCYNHLNDCWVGQASEPQPFTILRTTLCPEDSKRSHHACTIQTSPNWPT